MVAAVDEDTFLEAGGASSSVDTFPSLHSYSSYCLVLDYFFQNGSGLTCQDTFAKKVRTEGIDAVFGSVENAIQTIY